MGNDNLSYYAVRIETPGNTGSGVILNPAEDSDYLYILTAKHVVDTETNPDFIKVEHIEHTGTTLVTFKVDKVLCIPVDKIRREKENDGVSILVVKKSSISNANYLENIGILFITIDECKFKDCVVIGYPAKNDNIEIELYECKYASRLPPHGYQVFSSKPLSTYESSEVDSLQGLSGAGVFITERRSEKAYLVGIQVQCNAPQNLVCIDLMEIADEINDSLEYNDLPTIDVTGFLLSDGLEFDVSNLEFYNIKRELGKQVLENKDEIDKLRDDVNYKTRQLADSYLNLAIRYHEEGKRAKSGQFFRMAVRYCPSYKIYSMHAKSLRIQLNKDEIEKVIEDNSQILEDNQRVSLLESLVEINEKNNATEDLYKNYISLLHGYNKNSSENQDKIRNIYFKLGKLFVETDYYACENYLTLALTTNSAEPSSIKIYNSLIKSAYTHKEYNRAISLCKDALKQLPENNHSDFVSLYTALVWITYLQDMDDTNPQIYTYYKKAQYHLSKLKKNSKSHQLLTAKLKKTWLRVNSQKFDELLSSKKKVLSTINYLLESSDNLATDLQEIKESINSQNTHKDLFRIDRFFSKIEMMFKSIKVSVTRRKIDNP
jgi:tetratricopeptide (TPR) repeat protein